MFSVFDHTAPVCLFVYKRPDVLRRVLAALRANAGAVHTDLYVFSDAAARPEDIPKVKEVRAQLLRLEGFRSVTVRAADHNRGLAASIIEGVSAVLQRHPSVIVLEDDLVVAPNFLAYMNAALGHYHDNRKVFSVSGYTSPVVLPQPADVYFTRRASSWGWATWRDRWEGIDWKVTDYETFKNDPQQQKRFNEMGSDLAGMLKKQMEGRISSWAIRWTYHQFREGTYTVFPAVSKVRNDGFADGATHTAAVQDGRFATPLDAGRQLQFSFPHQPYLDARVVAQFTRPYSLRTRLVYKMKHLLNVYGL